MVAYEAIILKFDRNGDKTGWTYIEVPADVAQQLLPGIKRSFRVKGWLDNFQIAGKALLPMGEGNFILPLKQEIRRGVRKTAGAVLRVQLEHDAGFLIDMPGDLQECFDDEPEAFTYFNSLTASHQGYFIKWVNDAKTEGTKANHIAATINATLRHIDYGMMLRELKKTRG